MTLEDQIADLGMEDDLAELLRNVVAGRSVETAREAGYISVRPVDRHIAAYFNRRFVDVAVQPDQSRSAAIHHEGARVLERSTATHFLRLPTGSIDARSAGDLVAAALGWREAGHRWSGARSAGDQADLAGEICGTCFTEIATNGTCYC